MDCILTKEMAEKLLQDYREKLGRADLDAEAAIIYVACRNAALVCEEQHEDLVSAFLETAWQACDCWEKHVRESILDALERIQGQRNALIKIAARNDCELED